MARVTLVYQYRANTRFKEPRFRITFVSAQEDRMAFTQQEPKAGPRDIHVYFAWLLLHSRGQYRHVRAALIGSSRALVVNAQRDRVAA